MGFSELPRNFRDAGTLPEVKAAVAGDYDWNIVSVEDAADSLLLPASLLQFIVLQTIGPTCLAGLSSRSWRVQSHILILPNIIERVNGALGGIPGPESWDTKHCCFYTARSKASSIALNPSTECVSTFGQLRA